MKLTIASAAPTQDPPRSREYDSATLSSSVCPQSDTAGPRLLVVEDDADVRELLWFAFTAAGFAVDAVDCAEAALQQLEERSYALVLTDYALPRRTGGWLLETARASGLLEKTAVLVLTAHPSPSGLGGHRVLQKPIDLDELVLAVRDAL